MSVIDQTVEGRHPAGSRSCRTPASPVPLTSGPALRKVHSGRWTPPGRAPGRTRAIAWFAPDKTAPTLPYLRRSN
ncbi:hypothetical protein Ari01nite_67430 [Paractinoplanes rishiriensis]|uniref:Uncharacterized protein n=1 Tax=Paractinoplanes rishiriensis TaxID=1050105 RepID=A0A919MXS8_9ACTN|nr:hypothetical protein Ari01nite_67430 [Actinoplanes rishiriensis]